MSNTSYRSLESQIRQTMLEDRIKKAQAAKELAEKKAAQREKTNAKPV